MSDVGVLTLAAIVGYGVGSISFARLLGRIVLPGADLTSTQISFDGDGSVDIEGVSATSVAMRAGRRWGFLVALLDVGKAVVVTGAFSLLFPDTDADLVAATAVVAGHIWPVWHGFKGGFGVSPMLGGLLVIDVAALLVLIPLTLVVGVVVADRLVAYDGWTLALAPWFLFVRDDLAAAAYAVAITIMYWWAMRAEVRSHVEWLRASPRDWRSRFADIRKGYTGQAGG